MDKVGIVVLNYLNYKDTIECVETCKHLSYKNKYIVIVDNGSNNGSYEYLCKFFENENCVKVISCTENLGYAKGNNLGIRYCRLNEKCDDVLIINNDTYLKQKDFIEQLLSSQQKGSVGAIGPMIIGNDGKNQNPYYVDLSLKGIIKDFILAIFGVFGVYNLFIKIRKSNSKNKSENAVEKEEFKDQILHGSAILFTPLFFQHYDGMYPGTFLYYEENILGIMFKQKKLKFLYQPQAVIYHKEDGSSQLSFQNNNRVKSKMLVSSILKAIKITLKRDIKR